MKTKYMETLALLSRRKDYENQLKQLIWGSVEIREQNQKRYIYVHKRIDGVVRTQYVDEYSESLISQIEQNNEKAKAIKSKLRSNASSLKKHDFVIGKLNDRMKRNIDFAKRNLVDTIYKQAKLEGVAVTFLDTETIVEGGLVSNVSMTDIQKITNLKRAWQFVLDGDVVTHDSDYNILCMINGLVEQDFYYNAGVLRDVPVSIGGTSWRPAMPIESDVKEELSKILAVSDVYDRAIRALLYLVRSQLFIDGNKRTAVIFANHILLTSGAGIIVIPEERIPEYKSLLISYYETGDMRDIYVFLNDNCLQRI